MSSYAPDYIKDPKAIYGASFRKVRSSAQLEAFPQDLSEIVIRLIHACGMPEIVGEIEVGGDLANVVTSAIQNGNAIICDCEMVASGITRRFLPPGCVVTVTLNDERTPSLAAEIGTTRSAAAVELWEEHLDGAVVAIGNAPTALFHLLEKIASGGPRPAAILGFAVGFIGAAESKAALANFESETGIAIPFITLHGTRGGSAMASAAVNAFALAVGKGEG